ncbi:MAG TPA: cupin domain-containing protein, partial [Planctomycetota bacterium]
SAELEVEGPAISPNLCASFLRVVAGESLRTRATATSQMFFVIRGAGRSRTGCGVLEWGQGDMFVLPGDMEARHCASVDAALYWVTDEALLAYLGVRPAAPRFESTLYPGAMLEREIEKVAAEPDAAERNRIGVLYGNRASHETRSLTHTLWALLVHVPPGAVQRPHRHNSVAVDLVLDAGEGVYSMVGKTLDGQGRVAGGERVDWQPGAVFVTPPGLWHSHHNESERPARLLPVQDAGLHSYMRTLDQRMS